MSLRIILLIGFMTLLVLSSCRDNIPTGEGEASAIRNGDQWEAIVYHGKYFGSKDTMGIFLVQYNDNGYERSSVEFRAIPLCLNQKPLQAFDYDEFKQKGVASVIFRFTRGDGHIAGDRYKLIEDHALNYFELTSLNGKTGRIAGEFELAFEVDTSLNSHKLDPTVPDTIFFEDGEFEFYLDEGK